MLNSHMSMRWTTLKEMHCSYIPAVGYTDIPQACNTFFQKGGGGVTAKFTVLKKRGTNFSKPQFLGVGWVRRRRRSLEPRSFHCNVCIVCCTLIEDILQVSGFIINVNPLPFCQYVTPFSLMIFLSLTFHMILSSLFIIL